MGSDGRPAHAHGHWGSEEWINERAAFFAFLADRDDVAVLMNKEEVVAIGIARSSSDEDLPPAQDGVREVAVECGSLRFEGDLRIDMPEGQRRVLDTLNRPERFLTLRAGTRQHIVHKRHITRVLEKRGL